ncbi:ribonuclease catalytic domain-containing protein [Oleidesulfovibrio alaskensis]|uniref:ribonuclease catalytic domain-containing protein n=1 Tax=Oleidesulfovibrio alaskensis TaxID=58180 RepID=UPI000484EA2F|nr:ribonuclease catalytic domain-containing protein [Oleidesulfovibrio alaskensis]
MSATSPLVQYPGPGCIVEFMQGNKPQIAWVQEEQSGKLRLLTQSKRETKLAAARVMPWAGPQYGADKSRQEALVLLNQHEERRNTRAAALDPLELWELAQGEVQAATAQWFAELLHESPDADDIAAMGRVLLECKTHFKFQSPEFEIYDAEKVHARMTEQEARRKREQLASEGHDFLRALWETHQKRRTPPCTPEDAGLAAEIEALLRKRIAEPDDHDSEQLWKQISKGLPDVPHLPLLLAQAWGIVPAHHNFHLDRADYDRSPDWHAPHAQALADLRRRVLAARTEPCGIPFISIDSSSTRDIDDAFHIEPRADGGHRLRLAIACPALGWEFGSELDKAVMRRATSIYLPEGNLHMLPEELGTDFFSLIGQQERPALVMEFDIAPAGQLEATTLKACWVQLAANLSYADCEAVLNGDPGWDAPDNPAAAFADQLKAGAALSRILLEQRVSCGAVVIERPDPKTTLTGTGADTQVEIEHDSPTPASCLLVSEMMILANSGIALWAKDRDIALLHRTQDVGVPKEYAGVWDQPHDIARVVKALSSAVLETAPRRHSGIGVPAYSPVTSPLRRYPDLVNVAQLIHYLGTGTPRWSRDELDAMLPLLTARLDAAGQVQRFRPRYWKLLYFKQKGDKTWWDAVVTDENDAFVTVSLPDQQIFVRGRRSSFGERAHPGTRLMVRIGKVHPLNNEIQILDVMEQ